MNDLLKLFSKPDATVLQKFVKPTEKPKRIRKDRKKAERKVCEVCGTPFRTITDRKTCSEDCRLAMLAKHSDNRKKEPRRCVVCGLKIRIKGDRKTCSDGCMKIQMSRRCNKQTRKPMFRKCIGCGDQFEVERFVNGRLSKRKTCGTDCNNELLRRLTIERRAKK